MESQQNTNQSIPTPTSTSSPSKKLPQPIINTLLLITLAGAIAAVALPRLDQAAGSPLPGVIDFGGMTAVVVVLTAVVLRQTARAGLGLSRRWLALALSYNALIVAVKFWLAPAGLYDANQSSPFSTRGLGLVQDPNSPMNYVVTGITVGFMYLVVFYFLTQLLNGRLKRPKPNRAVLIIVALAVVAAIVTGGGIFEVPLFFSGDAMAYISYVFSSQFGAALIAALVVALVAAFLAVRQSVDDELVSGQTTSAASFFALGISLIVIYHILWIIYMIGLVSIWPFKTVTPK